MTPDLHDSLEHAWNVISVRYDVGACLPDIETLFQGVDRSVPAAASEVLLANMLGEVMECVGHFSPWYNQPAQTFGLVLKPDGTERHLKWLLSNEALEMYHPLLDSIAAALDAVP